MILHPSEQIVTAWAEHASGPGWSNQIVWVLTRCADGDLRIRGLQPSEQPLDVAVLFGVSATVAADMTAAVRAAVK